MYPSHLTSVLSHDADDGGLNAEITQILAQSSWLAAESCAANTIQLKWRFIRHRFKPLPPISLPIDAIFFQWLRSEVMLRQPEDFFENKSIFDHEVKRFISFSVLSMRHDPDRDSQRGHRAKLRKIFKIVAKKPQWGKSLLAVCFDVMKTHQISRGILSSYYQLFLDLSRYLVAISNNPERRWIIFLNLLRAFPAQELFFYDLIQRKWYEDQLDIARLFLMHLARKYGVFSVDVITPSSPKRSALPKVAQAMHDGLSIIRSHQILASPRLSRPQVYAVLEGLLQYAFDKNPVYIDVSDSSLIHETLDLKQPFWSTLSLLSQHLQHNQQLYMDPYQTDINLFDILAALKLPPSILVAALLSFPAGARQQAACQLFHVSELPDYPDLCNTLLLSPLWLHSLLSTETAIPEDVQRTLIHLFDLIFLNQDIYAQQMRQTLLQHYSYTDEPSSDDQNLVWRLAAKLLDLNVHDTNDFIYIRPELINVDRFNQPDFVMCLANFYRALSAQWLNEVNVCLHADNQIADMQRMIELLKGILIIGVDYWGNLNALRTHTAWPLANHAAPIAPAVFELLSRQVFSYIQSHSDLLPVWVSDENLVVYINAAFSQMQPMIEQQQLRLHQYKIHRNTIDLGDGYRYRLPVKAMHKLMGMPIFDAFICQNVTARILCKPRSNQVTLKLIYSNGVTAKILYNWQSNKFNIFAKYNKQDLFSFDRQQSLYFSKTSNNVWWVLLIWLATAKNASQAGARLSFLSAIGPEAWTILGRVYKFLGPNPDCIGQMVYFIEQGMRHVKPPGAIYSEVLRLEDCNPDTQSKENYHRKILYTSYQRIKFAILHGRPENLYEFFLVRQLHLHLLILKIKKFNCQNTSLTHPKFVQNQADVDAKLSDAFGSDKKYRTSLSETERRMACLHVSPVKKRNGPQRRGLSSQSLAPLDLNRCSDYQPRLKEKTACSRTLKL